MSQRGSKTIPVKRSPRESHALRELAAAMVSLRDAGEMRRLLDELWTPGELRDLALRWRLLKLLRDGTPQREIAGRLGVSLCKITRGSKLLKQPRAVSKTLLESHSTQTKEPMDADDRP